MIQVYDFEVTGLDDPKATQIGRCRLDEYHQLKICNFNKHRGKLWSAVIKEDKDYVYWLYSSNKIKDDLAEYLKDLL